MANTVMVIYYHQVVDTDGFSYQKIEVDKFEQQMRYLQQNGYHSLWFSELDGEIPDKAVIVSFDDGFKSVYELAAPIMKRYGIKGNVYLPTAYIGKDEAFMDWEMVRALSPDFRFEAHTHTHVDVRRLSDEQLRAEIVASDALFERNMGYMPVAFCLPFGMYHRKSLRALRHCGRYSWILASYYGRIRIRQHGQLLPRIGISNDDSMALFEKKLLGRYDWKGPLQRLRLMIQNWRGDRITVYDYE